MFERAYRVQMNTLEQMVFFLPALWLYALLVSDAGAAGRRPGLGCRATSLYGNLYARPQDARPCDRRSPCWRNCGCLSGPLSASLRAVL